jgi:hypothetical protein
VPGGETVIVTEDNRASARLCSFREPGGGVLTPIILKSYLFKAELDIVYLPEGYTIAGYLDAVGIDPIVWPHLTIKIGEVVWRGPLSAKPRPGMRLTIYVAPEMGGGGGSQGQGEQSSGAKTMQLVAVIGIMALAIMAPYALGIAGTMGGGLLSAGITLAGTMALSLLFSPGAPASDNEKSKPFYNADAPHNPLDPWGITADILGEHLVYPKQAARPYTESLGNDQYIRSIFNWGYGPLEFDTLKIGNTAIDDFDGVEVEHRYGYPDDDPLTKFTNAILEDQESADVTRDGGPVVRTTNSGAQEISVDLIWQQLVFYNAGDLKKQDNSVDIRIEYGPPFQDVWYPAEINGADGTGRFTVKAKQTTPLRVGKKWTPTNLTSDQQYDVRITRISPDGDDPQRNISKFTWSVLRTIRNVYPIATTKPRAYTVLVIKGSNQQVSDQFNAIVRRVCLDWDPPTSTWILRATRNPASLFRYVLQGPSNKRPVPDSRINLASLQEWHEFCTGKGFVYDRVHDFKASTWDTLVSVAGAGMASPDRPDGRWGVIIDRPQPTPVQDFTPRNSSDFSGELTFPKLPHALRIPFLNRDKNWGQDEHIVYAPGHTKETATEFDSMELPGQTVGTNVNYLGRYYICQIYYRHLVSTLNTGPLHLIARRGDYVRITHDVLEWGVGQGRLSSYEHNGSVVTSLFLDDVFVLGGGYQYACVVRQLDGTDVGPLNMKTNVGESNRIDLVTPIALAAVPMLDSMVAIARKDIGFVEALVRTIIPDDTDNAKVSFVPAASFIYDLVDNYPPYDAQITPPPDYDRPIIQYIRSDELVLSQTSGGDYQPAIQVVIWDVGSRPLSSIQGLQVAWREDLASAQDSLVSAPPTARVINLTPVDIGSTYIIKARWIRSTGQPGPWTPEESHTVTGPLINPPAPDIFYLDGLFLRWAVTIPRKDIAGYYLSYALDKDVSVEASVPAHEGILTTTSFDRTLLPDFVYAAYVKTVTRSGLVSLDAATLVLPTLSVPDMYVADADDKRDAGWPGTIEGGVIVGTVIEAQDTTLYLPDNNALYLPDNTAPYLSDSFTPLIYTTYYTPPGNTQSTDRLRPFLQSTGKVGIFYRWIDDAQHGGGDDDFFLPDDNAAFLPDDEAPFLNALLLGIGQEQVWTDSLGHVQVWTDSTGAVQHWFGSADVVVSGRTFTAWRGNVSPLSGKTMEIKVVGLGGSDQVTLIDFAIELLALKQIETQSDVHVPTSGLIFATRRSFRGVQSIHGTAIGLLSPAIALREVSRVDPNALQIASVDKNNSPVSGDYNLIITGY